MSKGRSEAYCRVILVSALALLAPALANAQEQVADPSGGAVTSETPACLDVVGLGPEMVLIEGGWFQMGSTETEFQSQDDERPRRWVAVERPFALSRCEVTVAQFRAFASATGHETDAEKGDGCIVWDETEQDWTQRADSTWRNPGFSQTVNDPVVCVSWNDAVAYAAWLSAETGQGYRLPSEAEWEYAARAGTTTPFWTGGCINTDQANYDGNYDYGDCGAKTRTFRQRTVAAGTLPANPWRLQETAGNVWEWVQDCWHDNYEGAPTSASAWEEAECARRVVRGGGWDFGPGNLRSASRIRDEPDGAGSDLGFRLARDL